MRGVADTLERHRILLVVLYAVVFVFAGLLLSATRMMWFDELATYYPATLPMAGLLSFFHDGMDVHTPVASLAVRAAIAVFGDHLATDRLPFTLGFLLMSLCVFRFVSRRSPAVYALAAMIFPVLTGVGFYATELRCYGLELGAAGLALVSWQEAAEGRHRKVAVPLLFLSLAAAISCHYFAVLVWIPFALAELVRLRETRKLDFPVLAALMLSPFPLLFFLPAIRAAKAHYAAGMWSRPNPGAIIDAYRNFFTLAFAPMLIAVVLFIVLSRFRTPGEQDSNPGPTSAERALAASLALLPAIGVPLSYFAGGFVWRYVLSTVAGLAIFLAFGICRALKGDRLAGTILAIVFFGWFCYKSAGTVRRDAATDGGLTTPIGQPLQNEEWMRALEAENRDLPIAFVPAVFFLEMQHYAPEPVRRRIVYPASENLALRFEGIDTGETNLTLFASRLPLPVVDYRAFVTQNRHFMICAETTNPTWLIEALLAEGAHLELRKRVDTHFVFDATLPNSPPDR